MADVAGRALEGRRAAVTEDTNDFERKFRDRRAVDESAELDREMMGHDSIDDRVADGEEPSRSGNDHLPKRKSLREAWTYEKRRVHEIDVHDEITVDRFSLTAQIERDGALEGHDDRLRGN